MSSFSITFILQCIALILIAREVVSATTHTQSGCYNTDVILSCPHYTKNNQGRLVWRFYDKTVSKWTQIASIRNGNLKVTSANTALDGRLTIHPSGSLEISSLKPVDETEYQCIVKQGSRKLQVIKLNVTCGKTTLIKRQVCVEEDVVLDCDAKHRTNPRKLNQVKWHKKSTSGNDVSWSLLLASSGSNAVVSNGFQLHGNGSLVLQRGRSEGDVSYRCDVTKNVPSLLDRHIVVLKNVRCKPANIKTSQGR